RRFFWRMSSWRFTKRGLEPRPIRLPPVTLAFKLPVNHRTLGRCRMVRTMSRSSLMLVTLLGIVGVARGQQETSPVEIRVLAAGKGNPIPCRIHLKDAEGKPQRVAGLPYWNDHFVCRGKLSGNLRHVLAAANP